MIHERPGSQILGAVQQSEGLLISKPSRQPAGKDVSTREPEEPTQSNDKRIFQNRDDLYAEVARPALTPQQDAWLEGTRTESIKVCGPKAQDNGNSEEQLKKQRAQVPRLPPRKAEGIDLRLVLPSARDTSPDRDNFEQAYRTDTTGWVVSPGVRCIYSKDGAVLLDIKNRRCYALNQVASHVWVIISGSPTGISFTGIVEVLETHFTFTHGDLERASRGCLMELQLASVVGVMGVGGNKSQVDRISLSSSRGRVEQLTLEEGQTMSGKQPFVERLETVESLIDRVLPQGVKSNADPRVMKLKDAIDDDPAKVNEGLGHVCSQLQLSLTERQAQRLFKEAVGISMRDYTRKKRLVFAARQLQDSDQPIKVIATNAGYQTQLGFRKAFHEMFSLTPAEFRTFWHGHHAAA